MQRYALPRYTPQYTDAQSRFSLIVIVLMVIATTPVCSVASPAVVPTVALSAPVATPIIDEERSSSATEPQEVHSGNYATENGTRFAHRNTVAAAIGNQTLLTIELALNSTERQRGLMHRTELAADAGMLFVFPRARPVSFWMKDTVIPLSIAYLNDDGVIVSIHNLEPLSEVGVPSLSAVAYALEVNQGFFAMHRIEVGDSISIADCTTLPPLIDGYDEAVVDRVLHLCR